jgi:hypothetical protein
MLLPADDAYSANADKHLILIHNNTLRDVTTDARRELG